MKASTRISSTAAAVLLAIGTLGAALPAAAQQHGHGHDVRVAPAAAHRVVIERFAMHGEPFPGNELRFRVHGTPGVEAYIEIPGIQAIQPMTEVRPGVYEAAYVMRPGDRLVRAVATLKEGTSHASSQIFPDRDLRARSGGDQARPEILALSPSQGERISERGWTRISAQVADRGTGVASVNLQVDGRDVSERTRFNGSEVHYAENLQPGRHVAELAVRDRAGNVTRQAWSFFVVADNGSYGYWNR
jgi:hypothetical protein